MIVVVAIRQRAYPEPGQVEVLVMHSDHDRFIRNLVVEQRLFCSRYRPYRVGERQSWPDITDTVQLKELRVEEPWLAEGASCVQQQALRVTRQAFKNWWGRPDHFARPKFKSKLDHTHSFQVAGAGYNFRVSRLSRKWGQIKLPKLNTLVRFRITRPWAEIEAAKSVRVTCNPAGQWHLSFPSPQPKVETVETGAVVGIDRGITNTIATSDGTFAHIPTLTASEQERYMRLSRAMARRTRGSARYEKARVQRAKIRQRLNDRRTNWIEQTTTALVRDHDLIVLENLQIRNMVKSAKGTTAKPGSRVRQKAGLNRAIHAQRWGEFARRLQQKADAATTPKCVVFVRAASTSLECSTCGHTEKSNRKSQAVFSCVACGHEANADVDAAKVIRDRGLKLVPRQEVAGAGRGRKPVVPPPGAGVRAKRQTSEPEPSDPPGEVAA